MKTPKEVRQDADTRIEGVGQAVIMSVVGVVVLGIAFTLWNPWGPSDEERLTTDAIAFMSSVQPGDTLYWFNGDTVEPLPIIRNIPVQQVIRTSKQESYTVILFSADNSGQSRHEQRTFDGWYSYNQVYSALVTTREAQ